MKQIIYTLLLLSIFSIFSCRKDKIQLSIKQYDSVQIANYIASHHLTGFVKDLAGGDTSGIYYKILTPGDSSVAINKINFDTQIPMVYSLKTFDGTYVSTDTIANHYFGYAGHIQASNLPLGLQTAIVNGLKWSGGSIEVLVPSHLAYGINGSGQGSSQVANNRIAGNECLDYYAHVIKLINTPHKDPKTNQDIFQGVYTQYIPDTTYDQLVIKNYMKDSSLVGYKETPDGLWYKVLTPGTGNDYITDNSTATVTYTGQLFNATIFDQFNTTGGTAFEISSLTPGVAEGLKNYALLNTKISFLIPSSLAYGAAGQSPIPPFSCLRFTFVVDSVSP